MQNLREQFDTQNLHEVIADLPNQFTTALDSTDLKINSNTTEILYSGLGGSALPANILKTYLSASKINFNIPIKINRAYDLPLATNVDWCGFFVSYSGNTEETLSALEQAEKLNLKQIVIMSNGGKLKEIAEVKGYNFIQIPDYKQPRMAYGFIVGALIKILINSNLIENNIADLNKDVINCLNKKQEIEKQGYELAGLVKGKLPIIYASNLWKYLAMVWKINFNENSKTQSFWNCFSELNHNEMIGFTNLLTEYKVIILKDLNSHERINKRIDIFQKILGEKLNVEIINMPDGSPFYQMIYMLSLGLWTSYYLALINNLDPTPVDLVEKFKKLMNE